MEGAQHSMKKIYLAYGSNLNLEQMEMRCPDAAVIGTAVLKNYQLIFRGTHSSGVATIEKKRGLRIPVLLWEITARCENALDRYEGHPHLYHKENVTVQFNGNEVVAMVYIMNEGPPPAIPGAYYYKTILDGYRDCGFDETVLNKAVEETAEACND